MRNLTNNKTLLVTVLVFLLMAVFATTLYSQEPTDQKVDLLAIEKIANSEFAMKNLEMALNSDNPGLKMSAVHFIGKYQLTAFENQLVEKLNEADKFKEQRALAISLYQMGTLSCIAALNEYSELTDSENMKEFCGELISYFQKEEIEKAKYVNSLVIDSEISE